MILKSAGDDVDQTCIITKMECALAHLHTNH